MGMAASQARLLSITARLSNNEMEQQSIAYSKQRLSDNSEQINDAYLEALNKTKYQVLTGYNNSEANYADLTYNQITGCNTVANGKQYLVKDKEGKVLVNSAVAKAYDNNNGDFNRFLRDMGYTQSDIDVSKVTESKEAVHEDWDKYLASVETPFTDISNNRSYGMFLFPQYLSQTYGGLNSIKRTLEYVSSGYPVLKSMEKSAQYSDNSATYGEIFAMFQRCNADPRRYVNSNGQYNEATRRLDNVGTASNIPVLSTSAVHYGLKASSTTSAVSVTVNITSGSYTNAIFKLVKFPGDGGSSVYVNYKPTSTSFTIYVSSFKTGTTSSVYPRLTLVASNTSDDYTTSYKFGLTRTNK